jgi:hypothetical protein
MAQVSSFTANSKLTSIWGGVIKYFNGCVLIGQESLKKNDCPPTAHKIQRRRIRTVIDRYITLAVKFVRILTKISVSAVSVKRSWQGHFFVLSPKQSKPRKFQKVGLVHQITAENAYKVGLVHFNCAFLCGRFPKLRRAQLYVPAERNGSKTLATCGFVGTCCILDKRYGIHCLKGVKMGGVCGGDFLYGRKNNRQKLRTLLYRRGGVPFRRKIAVNRSCVLPIRRKVAG